MGLCNADVRIALSNARSAAVRHWFGLHGAHKDGFLAQIRAFSRLVIETSKARGRLPITPAAGVIPFPSCAPASEPADW